MDDLTRQIFLLPIPPRTEVDTSALFVLNGDPITSMSVDVGRQLLNHGVRRDKNLPNFALHI